MYVDDILVTGEQAIASLISQLHHVFALKDLGEIHFFLGIEAIHTALGGILLNQAKYVKDLLKKASMTKAKPMPTSMISSSKLSAYCDGAFLDPTPISVKCMWPPICHYNSI